jgi:predicted dehydrogenase
MNVLILGLGSIGKRHARCFLEAGADAVSGFDPDPERRAAFAALFGAQVYDDQDEALGAAPDLAVVASPNVFHARQAIAAIRAGNAVLVEKPLAGDLEEAEALARLSREVSAFVHMGSNWKFHPAFTAIKAWLEDGRIGRVTGGQVVAGGWLPDWHPGEDYRRMYAARADLGGGAVLDTHELDMLTWLLGPVATLRGFTARSGALEIETEDVAACALAFESGALVTLLADYIQRIPRRRYLLSGDEGTIEWDLQDGAARLRLPGRPDAETVDAGEALNAMYLRQARHVLDALDSGAPPMTGIDQALSVLALQAAWRTSGVYPQDR